MLLTWLMFFVEGLFSRLFLQQITIDSLSFILIGVTSFVFLLDLSRSKIPKNIFLIFFFSYCFRIFLMCFDLYGRDIFILPNSGLDSEMYHNAALNGMATGDFLRGGQYSKIIAFVYNLFGVDRNLSQYVNVLLSMNSILLTYKTMELFNVHSKVKKATVLIMAFLPNFAILSSILLRESFIIFLCTWSVYWFSKWYIQEKKVMLVLAFALALLASTYHSGSLALILAYSLFIIAYDRKRRTYKLTSKSLFYIIALTVLFAFFYTNYSETFFGKFSDVETISDVTAVADSRVAGGSGYSIDLQVGNAFIDFIINTPIRVLYFVLSPLPWQWRGVNDVIAFLFSSLFYGYSYLYAFKILHSKKGKHRDFIVFFLVIALISTLIFSWGVSNAGTALRHRDKFVSIFIILLSLSWDNKKYT